MKINGVPPTGSTQLSGRVAEDEALKFLEREGFRLVMRNYRAKTGEIDLIMNKKGLLTFVEVRLRRNPNYGSGADSVTWRKQRKIINTAKHFLQRYRQSKWQSFRFDVISIGENIDWIPGAFTLDP